MNSLAYDTQVDTLLDQVALDVFLISQVGENDTVKDAVARIKSELARLASVENGFLLGTSRAGVQYKHNDHVTWTMLDSKTEYEFTPSSGHRNPENHEVRELFALRPRPLSEYLEGGAKMDNDATAVKEYIRSVQLALDYCIPFLSEKQLETVNMLVRPLPDQMRFY